MQIKKNAIAAMKEHCIFCFQVLEAHLNKKQIPKYPNNIINPKAPIFVTWNYKGELRGCIGTFTPEILSQILPQYALISALQDDRFKPITKKQLPYLDVSVSILINFQKNKKAYDWILGKHGIIIQFQKNKRQYQATFLPEVAAQWGWDQRQTLKQLVQKSGYTRPLQTVQELINLTTYESSKITLSYDDYVKQLK